MLHELLAFILAGNKKSIPLKINDVAQAVEYHALKIPPQNLELMDVKHALLEMDMYDELASTKRV